MPEEFLEEAEARRPIPPARIVVAVVLVVALWGLGLLYHDGVLATRPLAEVVEDGALYRVRGEAVEVDGEGFLLAGDGVRLRVLWNLTQPSAGVTYVVNGMYDADAGALRADAVVRAYVLR